MQQPPPHEEPDLEQPPISARKDEDGPIIEETVQCSSRRQQDQPQEEPNDCLGYLKEAWHLFKENKERLSIIASIIYFIVETVLYWKGGVKDRVQYLGILSQIIEFGIIIMHITLSRIPDVPTSVYRMFILIELYFQIIFAQQNFRQMHQDYIDDSNYEEEFKFLENSEEWVNQCAWIGWFYHTIIIILMLAYLLWKGIKKASRVQQHADPIQTEQDFIQDPETQSGFVQAKEASQLQKLKNMLLALIIVPIFLIAIIGAIFYQKESEEDKKKKKPGDHSQCWYPLLGLILQGLVIITYVLPIILGFTFYGRQYNMTHLLIVNEEDSYTQFNAVFFSILRTFGMLFFLGNIIVGKPNRFLSSAQDLVEDGSNIFQVIGLVNDLSLKK